MDLISEDYSCTEYSTEGINELIIHYVRNRPQLWDLNDKCYRNNGLKKKLWCEVAHELNMTEEFVKNRWRNLRDRYIKEKKKSVTKSGQAAVHFVPWSFMEHLHFLSDTVEPRKTITNFESLEHPLSRSDTSPTSLETFQSEEYMYNIQEEFQDNMWDNIRQTEQTDFCSPHLLNMPSRPSNSASPRPNNILSCSNSALIRLDSVSPRPNSSSPRPNNASPRPHYASSRPNSAFSS
ncbi:uncharacterized protein LOC105184943 isoform X1 [Harpegnathos saltator]|uniref:uncharacterized protein LOC105184943 isoform X1 n=1 Tax=Harpegnathos saltator TaxID=610380 RepID=UPI000DBEE624|nr:uncharacterized protein LOC105184943 isoform X1 [Harpegnathos saltator]